MTDLYERFIDSLRNSPLGPLIEWIDNHPRLAAWLFLSVGMVTLLIIEARDVGLMAGQWAALIVSTVLVAGACIWIISFEDDIEDDTVQ
jgi:hypothetical protein